LQDELGDALGTRVRISLGARRGKLQIDLGSVDDLDRVVAVIARGLERQAGIGSAPDLGSG
jgi:ParB family chromosome partitioning protein